MQLTAPIVVQVASLLVVGLTLLTSVVSLFGVIGRVLRKRQQGALDKQAFLLRLEEARVAVGRKKHQADLSWEGWRKFVVESRAPACPDGKIVSFHLRPHDGRPLPDFHPGQFLTFQLDIPGQKKPVIRCYSLSDAPSEERFRVSIKKLELPDRNGLASGFFHEQVKVGDLLDVKAPAGKFFLDLTRRSPAVLVGGGVGVTPMISMFTAISRKQPDRTVWLFYGIRHGTEVIDRQRLEAYAAGKPTMRLVFCYSDPTDQELPLINKSAAEYQAAGKFMSQSAHAGRRIGVDLIRRLLPTDAQDTHEFFVCGPGPMMLSVTDDLKAWGVPENHIHTEAFGPSSVSKTKRYKPVSDLGAATPQITFAKSGRTIPWNAEAECLLRLAEQNDIEIPSGCWAGDCHTCKVAIRSGEISYLKDPSDKPEPGTALLCIAAPVNNLTIDA